MKRLHSFGRILSRKEQQKVLGGNVNIGINCNNGVLVSASCGADYNPIINLVDNSVKCCHRTLDCCFTSSCTTGLSEQGTACKSFFVFEVHVRD